MTTPATEQDHDVARKRLRIRAWRRGMREMDMLLGPYADARLDALDAAGLAGFAALMEVNDQTLFAWLCGNEPCAPAHRAALAQVAAFHDIALV